MTDAPERIWINRGLRWLPVKWEGGNSSVETWQVYTRKPVRASEYIRADLVARKDAALLAAEELAEIMANPVRSDDGLYDYYQADIDAALANWRAAMEDTQ